MLFPQVPCEHAHRDGAEPIGSFLRRSGFFAQGGLLSCATVPTGSVARDAGPRLAHRANELYRARVLKRLGVHLENYAGANPASRLKHTHGHEAGCGVSLDGLDFSRKARVAQVAVPTGSRASIETGSLGASACPGGPARTWTDGAMRSFLRRSGFM